MFEVGYDQAEKVAQMTEGDARYRYFTYIKDLAGVDRVIILGCAE